jgi:diadenosine tetraphosphate (Ap4A) HIT family hydrolase
MSDCAFCNMEELQGDRILQRNETNYVILSSPYLVWGHTLVIPRRHVATFTQLPGPEFYALMEVVKEWQERLKAAFTQHWRVIAGCDFSQHDRLFMKPSEISVPQHLHCHLRPRRYCDELYWNVQRHETPLFRQQQLAQETIEELKALLGAS